MEEEIWKDIPEYEGCYQASNLGRIRSLDRLKEFKDGRKSFMIKGRIRTFNINKITGYVTLKLSKQGIRKVEYVHRLVASAFLGEKSNSKIVVDHINSVKHDNKLINLQIISQRENIIKGNRKKDKSSKYIGVYKTSDNTWRSSINLSNNPIKLGTFKNEKVAHEIYETALSNSHLFNGSHNEFKEAIIKLTIKYN